MFKLRIFSFFSISLGNIITGKADLWPSLFSCHLLLCPESWVASDIHIWTSLHVQFPFTPQKTAIPWSCLREVWWPQKKIEPGKRSMQSMEAALRLFGNFRVWNSWRTVKNRGDRLLMYQVGWAESYFPEFPFPCFLWESRWPERKQQPFCKSYAWFLICWLTSCPQGCCLQLLLLPLGPPSASLSLGPGLCVFCSVTRHTHTPKVRVNKNW